MRPKALPARPRFALVATVSALVAAVLALASAGWGARAAAQASGTFDLRDFGAVGDGTTDDAPALQAALDALAAAGGGTLVVPAGSYVIATPVSKDFTGIGGAVTIEGVASDTTVDYNAAPHNLPSGLNLVSEFYPRTGAQHAALRLRGLDGLTIKDVAFVGTVNVTTDAINTIVIDNVGQAVINHCEFYGLSTTHGDGVIVALRSRLRVEQSKFLGTVANSGVYGAVIQNLEWKDVSVTDTVFTDFGLRPELFGKTGYGAPYAWVNVGNAAPVTPDSPRRQVTIRRVFLDEGGYNGLASIPFRYSPTFVPIDLYYVTALRMNVSNLNTTGNYLDGLDGVLIESSRYGWSHLTDSAVYVLRSGHVILDRVHTEAEATRLRADPSVGSLTVINSVYEDLASQAAVTRVINTQADTEDPVWYVRDRFATLLGREPDPAAHFYWSRRLLSCADGDAACQGTQRAALDAYLNDGPAADFDIGGVVKDDEGTPVSGVTVTLSGSQSVAAVTDAQGRYRFAGLPTSGVYTVTASKPLYTFGAPLVFDTPAGDQTGNFTGTGPRFSVRGRLTEPGGAAIAGATVTLASPPAAPRTATTDASGNYSFANVSAARNYTLTPSKLGYRFAPASVAVSNLTADRTADFTGTPGAHTIAGRVATPGGFGVAGLTVTLAGSKQATTTTDANGDYSFTNVPAAGNYTITPSGPGLVAAPLSAAFDDLAADATADFVARFRVNHARAAHGATAAASSTADTGRLPSAAINGDRRGQNWGFDPQAGSAWQDATANAFPDWLEVSFDGARTIDEIDVFSAQGNLFAPVEPTEALTFAQHGLTSFQVEHWTGSAWATVPGGLVASNNKVWVKLTFAPLTTTKIRVLVNHAQGGQSRIAEVEAWGVADSAPTTVTPPAPPAPSNLALGKPATQSSGLAGGVAARAVDGNTSGAWPQNSVTHTNSDAQAWWQVDLGSVQQLQTIKVWNRTDGFSDRLSNFYILVSDVPFASTNLTTTLAQPGVSAFHTPGAAGPTVTLAAGRTGRYVRVQLAGTNYLSLAEVEVMGAAAVTPTPTPTPTPQAPVNLAQNKPAAQSSEILGAAAARAVDGNTSGAWNAGSVAHTNNDAQAWWQVDLGEECTLDTVKVWNRTDGFSERLTNFYVLVSDAPFASTSLGATLAQPGVSAFQVAATAGTPTTVNVNRTGRYIRVQLVGTNYLTLAEVEAWGTSGATPTPSPSPTPTPTPTPTPAPTPTPTPSTVNLARGRPAAQSSEILGAAAARAVDGNANGAWGAGSVTHTNSDAQAWWQVDLGSVQQLQTIKVWNRTDGFSSRLNNFYVLVSDVPFASTDLSATLAQPGVSAFHTPGPGGGLVILNLNRTARYVRVQLAGTNYLTLAEVEIF